MAHQSARASVPPQNRFIVTRRADGLRLFITIHGIQELLGNKTQLGPGLLQMSPGGTLEYDSAVIGSFVFAIKRAAPRVPLT